MTATETEVDADSLLLSSTARFSFRAGHFCAERGPLSVTSAETVQVCGQTLTPKVAAWFKDLAQRNPPKKIQLLNGEGQRPIELHRAVEKHLKSQLKWKQYVFCARCFMLASY